ASTPVELARIFRIFSAMALTLWLGLGLFAREVVALAAPPAYHGAAAVVPLLVPAVLFAGLYVFMPGPAIRMKTRQIAAINITGGSLNVALNLSLIPILGLVGAAIATLASSVGTFFLNVIVSQRSYPVPHDWPRLALATLTVASMIA